MSNSTENSPWAKPTYRELRAEMDGILQTLKSGDGDTVGAQLDNLKDLQSKLELELATELSVRKQLSSAERQLYTDMISELLAINMELSRVARTYMVTVKNELNNLRQGMKTISSYKSDDNSSHSILSISS